MKKIKVNSSNYVLLDADYKKQLQLTPLWVLYRAAIMAQIANCGYIICHAKKNKFFNVYEPIDNEFALETIYNELKKIKTMKKEKQKVYTIDVHYDAVVRVAVTAINEQEAIIRAKEAALEQQFDDVFYTDSCVVDIDEDDFDEKE